MLLLCNSYYNPLKLIDAFFTATSAVCVTGLIVVDTGTDLSPASQMTVLLLIQLGGIGVMTAATTFSLLLGERIGLRQRMGTQKNAFFFPNALFLDTPSFLQAYSSNPASFNLFFMKSSTSPLLQTVGLYGSPTSSPRRFAISFVATGKLARSMDNRRGFSLN